MTRAEKLKAAPIAAPEAAPPVAPAAQAPEVSALAAEAAALDTAAAPPGEGEPPTPPAPELSTAEILRPLARLLFDVLAPKWQVGDEESAALAESYAAVLDKYFPGGFAGRWAAEFNALILTVAIIGPRLKIAPRDMPKQAAAAPAAGVEVAPAIGGDSP